MTLPAKAATDFRSNDPRDRYPTEANRVCRVCGDAATGMYFGALVCVPCKTFFLRYAGDGFSYECKYNKNCDITTATRTQCKFCRYQKCLRVGMCRRVRPAQIEAQDGQQLCVVCQDVANGVHFGVLTCEGCKKFFRRGLVEQRSYRCRNDQNCSINPSTRNACRFCRFKKCLKAGMSRAAIQMGRPSKMSVFENSHVHRMPQARDSTDLHTVRVGPSDPLSFRPGIEPSTEHRTSTAAPFPSWMEDPLMGAPGEGGRNPWTHIDTLRQGWHGVGPVPLVGKFSPAKMGPDDPEGERSGGSACPDSTMVRDETDPFLLPVDFTRSFTSGEEDYLHDWSEGPSGNNFRRDTVTSGHLRDASPVALPTACKLEVLTSDDDGETSASGFKRNRFDGNEEATSGGFKRGRYDPGTSNDCFLPQGGCFDLNASVKYSPAVGKMEDIQCMPSLCNNDDVSSSGIVGRAFADVLLLPTEVRNPVSDLDDQVPGCGAATSCFVNQTRNDVRIGSPSVSSSCPLDLMKMEKVEVQSGQGQAAGQSTSGAFGSGCPCQMASGKGFLSSERLGVSRDWRETGDAGSLDPERPRGSSTVEEVGNQCWQTIKGVIPAYHRFVNSGTVINSQLKEAYQSWKRENSSDCADELSLWIQTTVVPAYTTISVTYCKSLPDFTSLSPVDQRTLIAGGQSESRILVAALHWYDASERRFRNFLSWREDCPQRPDSFKVKLRDFADRITKLHLDPIEAALLNAVGVFSTDYPNLKDSRAIGGSRSKILTTMKSYIASNNSAPGERLETLFRVLREAQSLGAEHVALTNTRTLGLPSTDDSMDKISLESPPGHSMGTTGQSGQAVTSGQSNTAELITGQSASGVSDSSQFTSGQSTTGQSTVTGSLTTNHSVLTGQSLTTGESLTTGLPSNGQPLDGQSPSATAKSPSDEPTDVPVKKQRREDSPHGELSADSLPVEILPSKSSPA